MSYCDEHDVETYFYGRTFDCEGWLTSQEVASLIASEAQYIDMMLRCKYTLPITNNDDIQFLKMVNERLVVGIIDEMDRVVDQEGNLSRSRNFRKEAMGWLEALKSGKMRLASSSKGSNIKFNSIDSQGNTVEKRYKDAFAQPASTILDRERRTIVVVTE
ncbi:MAG: DUF1320 family protein [Candidatus Omnitrophica bacterium]|nr:DUF1320 family protein [Candidatus Omnitrophota bacterium]